MAKNQELDTNQNITELRLMDAAQNDMSRYAAKVILERAIPDARDGLKIVRRRILFGTHQLGIGPSSPHRKSARIVGDVMGKYHPHGDSSIYGALVNMSQDFRENLPFIDGHGNFGSIINPDGAAAMRYTEARISKFGDLMLQGLKQDAVDMAWNFDNEEKEATILPAPAPIALINGAQGIAVGMATKILPHNPGEMMRAAMATARNPEISNERLAQIVKGPDFPTGGILLIEGNEVMDEIATGRGRFTIRAKVDVVEDAKEPHLHITELPYGGTVSNVLKGMTTPTLLPKLKALNVVAINDETAQSDVSIKVVFKPRTPASTMRQVEALLYKTRSAGLQVTETSSNLMIYEGKPEIRGLRAYLNFFNEFRLETLKRLWNNELGKLNDRLEIIEGLLRTEDILDEVIKLSRESKDLEEATTKLIERFDFSHRQAEKIASLRLYQLGRTNFDALRNEQSEKLARKSDLELYLTDKDEAINQLYYDLEATLVKVDRPRLTQLTSEDHVAEVEEITEVDLIESKPIKVVLKEGQQVLTIRERAFANQIDKYTNGDIIQVIDAMTDDYIVIATESGGSVTRLVDSIPVQNLDMKCEPLFKEIPDLKSDDELVGAVAVSVDDKKPKSRLVMVTAEGQVKAADPSKLLPNVNTRRYIKRLGISMNLKTDNDKVVFAKMMTPAEMEKTTLEIKLKDETKKSKQVTRKLELKHFAKRSDSAGHGGVAGVNTRKGELPFIELKEVTE